MENEKYIYDKIYDELNRCRDWPIKILGFTSGLYLSVLGFLKLFSEKVTVSPFARTILIVGIVFFSLFCIYILAKQHLEYLRYRNIQIRLQNKMNIGEWRVSNVRVIPEKWDREVKIRIWTRCQGWLFYSFYIICLSGFSIYIVSHL